MSAHAAFQDNLKFVRTAVPQYIDSNLQVSCHALATSIQFGPGAEVVKALDFADRWVTSQPNVPPMLRLYHAIVKAFYLLRYVVSQLLPPIRPDDAAYPQLYLRVWVDVLDCSLFCSGVADANFAIHSSGSNGVQIRHICPSPSQLAFAGQLLEMDVLRDAVQADTNVELRARYEMLVCKWLWATQELGVAAGAHSAFARYEKLESRRPEMLRLLHESLERVSAHVNCTDATAEIMALFGPKLIEQNRLENGEETLKSAIRLGLHSKNVLLQTRLLVDIFRLYSFRRLVQAQATTAEKYEKKVNVLQRRVAQALAENATSTSILSWSAADT
ncbi:hypothetical protein P43SY_010604 [Pythium insidiosum]|uniref:Uncharacterized protein n=1 Tax=Pythium insidiosum TaxID=114742 RepID=A0AAD5LBV3_PYTIN|nr:hypothetical protein P43SY_010604 [Pythium insidiosum]